jgi:hypothetical protein
VLLTNGAARDITDFRLLGASPALAATSGLGDEGGDPPTPPQFVPQAPPFAGYATHYGSQYNGQTLGCGAGIYVSSDPSIIAVGPAHYRDLGCGSVVRVCGSAGCVVGVRQDSCPGCTGAVVDLSEAGIDLVCGPGASACPVTIESGRFAYP